MNEALKHFVITVVTCYKIPNLNMLGSYFVTSEL